jgi:predicted DNA-binding transcriptional regulator YafY
MRIDRLLAITTYLLNRDIVTANELARRFEVSERTIQRDIDAINMAGIPVVSIKGVGGGYQILDTFKLSKSTTNANDINTIRLALKSLNTALESQHIDTTIEKIDSISYKPINNIHLDFGVAHENKKVSEYLKLLEKAINENKVVNISYINAVNEVSCRNVEPISINYKWYAWYLVAYCLKKEDYRIFKLSRVQDLSVTGRYCTKTNDVDEYLFDKLMDSDNREYIDIEFEYAKDIEHLINEYFPNTHIVKGEGGKLHCHFSVPENERIWYALLLSFGNNIKILKPDSLKKRIYKDAVKLTELYKDDI